ncbi:MAG: chemotaxis response regulator protein-glutamate methylesterase [Candidatus Nealsonbacteria bacterium]|nr:chemotaxis response regulator protein-glutamate methylesterase [Candidatus Nealsonbacteria bacterium]
MVVDDSAVIRAMICDNIGSTSDMEVAGTARSGEKALEVFESVHPDVVTLDVQMPGMDGLETLDSLLTRHPVPVIMVSSLTRAGADVTLDALERGALDYIAKPERGADAKEVLGEKLLRTIRSAAGTNVGRILQIRRDRKQRRAEQGTRKAVPTKQFDTAPEELADKCIAIGISTGGPPALASLFETLQPPMPGIVVVQHMPASFTKPFAWRLNSLSSLSIKEATIGDSLRPNHVLIAPGGSHLKLRGRGKFVKVLLNDGPTVSSHKPSVDVLMADVARIFGNRCLGVIMTGMGRDGAQGCADIRAAGGYVLGQDEATSDVYGMNKVAHVEGNVDQQFGLSHAAGVIGNQVKRLWCRAPVGVR